VAGSETKGMATENAEPKGGPAAEIRIACCTSFRDGTLRRATRPEGGALAPDEKRSATLEN